MIVECMNYPQVKGFSELDKRLLLRIKTERASRLAIRKSESQSTRIVKQCCDSLYKLIDEIHQLSGADVEALKGIIDKSNDEISFRTYNDFFNAFREKGVNVATDEEWALYKEWMEDRCREKILWKNYKDSLKK